MKVSKLIMLALLAGSLLAAAGTANATTTIDIYGCSAQFFLWSSMNSGNPAGSPASPNFLADTTANGGLGCSNVTWAYDSTGTTYFWASGTGCATNIGGTQIGDGSGSIDISVGYKTSNDAIWSVNGVPDPEVTSGFCTPYTERKLATGTGPGGTCNSGSCTGTTCTPVTAGTVCTNAATCQPITLGASDEKANYFTQISWGNKYGPYYTTSNPVICREFGSSGTCLNGAPVEPMPSDTTPLYWYNPIADPTAFYVNKAVTESTCSGSTATPNNNGDMCMTNADCTTGGTCASATVTNINRMMAAQIFTGQVANWNDLGGGFTSLPVWACMRHTGAGTNITFDYAVLGHNHNWLPNGGSTAMLNEDSIVSGTTPPNVYFYDTITTQLNCVNGEISSGTYNSAGSLIGAIGYTDADRSTSIGTGTSLPNVVMTSYNGVLPYRANVRNGVYDFWSKNYLYFNPANYPVGGQAFTVFDLLTRYASNPAMITALPTGKGNFWAAIGTGTNAATGQTNYSYNGGPAIPTGEMYYMKSGADILPGPVLPPNPNNPVNP